MSPTRRPLAVTAVTALLAALSLTACDSNEEPAPAEDTTPVTTEEAPATADEEIATSTADEESATSMAPPVIDDDATTATSGPGAEEAGTQLQAADGSFAITLPEGWEDAANLVTEDSVLLAAKEIERKDEFFTNVVVTKEEYVSNLTTAVEEAAQHLAGEDGEYEVLDPAPVDGNRAPGYRLIRDIQGTTVHQTQRWISNQGTLYVVTFSAIESQAEDAEAALEEILDSWSWQD